MATDLSLSSDNQVLNLIKSSNNDADVSFSDVALGIPAPSEGEKNTILTVSSIPNSRYTGSVDIEYDRLPLDGFLVYGPADLIIPPQGTLNNIVDGFNTLYGANLDYTDIPDNTDISSVDYDGATVTFTALSSSFAYIGDLAVSVKWESTQLSTIILVDMLDGLEFPPTTQPQVITFNQPSNYGLDESVTLSAVSDSGLPVSLTSTTPAVCSIDGSGNVSFLSIGTCTIKAEQAGNDDYFPADEVVRSFDIEAVVPNAPTNVVGTGGNLSVSVAFSAPAFTGGSPITGYTAKSTPGNFTASGAASPLVVSGLAASTTYTFTVTATNAIGTSVESAPSADVTTNAPSFAPSVWTTVTRYLGSSANTFTPKAYATDRNGVWVAVASTGDALRSVDNGVTWTALTKGLNSGSTTAVFNSISTDRKGTWIAVANAGLAAISTDNGITWTAKTAGLSTGSLGNLTYILADGNTTWMAINQDGYASKSLDSGVTWVSAGPRGLNSGTTSDVMNTIATNGSGVWMVGFQGGYAARSINNAANWSAMTRYLSSGAASGNIITIGYNNNAWVANCGGFAARSVNNGANWTALPAGLNSGVTTGVQKIAADTHGNWVSVHVSGYSSKSVDNGATWTAMARGLLHGGPVATNLTFVETDNNGKWLVSALNGYMTAGTPS